MGSLRSWIFLSMPLLSSSFASQKEIKSLWRYIYLYLGMVPEVHLRLQCREDETHFVMGLFTEGKSMLSDSILNRWLLRIDQRETWERPRRCSLPMHLSWKMTTLWFEKPENRTEPLRLSQYYANIYNTHSIIRRICCYRTSRNCRTLAGPICKVDNQARCRCNAICYDVTKSLWHI